MGVNIAFSMVAVVAVLVLVMVTIWRHSKFLPHNYALSLVEPLYEFLCNDTSPDGHYLLTLHPGIHERVALAEVVASLSRNIVECYPQRVRLLSRVWQLEEALVWHITHCSGHRRSESMEWMLWLHPSVDGVYKVAKCKFSTPTASLQQLLLVLYVLPDRVMELIARHPYTLSWDDVGHVVEVLKMHSVSLSLPNTKVAESPNVEMLLLRLAAVEGVGDAVALARRLSASKDRALRDAALNILLEESLFPAMTQSEMECS